ncbi:MAG: ribonuclease PH [Dehalococcoidia bacterium]|nr:ribonuclease PH [Dehalococcoidia bacterium]
MGTRSDGRAPDQLRSFRITPGYLAYAEGSALVESGNTRVICAVSVEERIPPFLRGTGKGWISAEYGMLPRATATRTPREAAQGRERGRSHEIQRLIGRALRAIVRLDGLGERTLLVDCDVLQADGGTRVAAINGAYVALYQAALGLVRQKLVRELPFRCAVAGMSAGLVGGQPLLDLCYEEDSRAELDLNLVATDKGELVEVQGTAEAHPFSRGTYDLLLDMGLRGLGPVFAEQQRAIASL